MQVRGLPRYLIRAATVASRIAAQPHSEAAMRDGLVARWRRAVADGLTTEKAAQAVGASRASLYRWEEHSEPRSRRPIRQCPKRWSSDLVQAVERLRVDYPMWGRAKLGPLVRAEGFAASDATVGRIIQSLVERGVVTPVPMLRRVEASNPILDAFQHLYNHHRPHGALAGITPAAYLGNRRAETRRLTCADPGHALEADAALRIAAKSARRAFVAHPFLAHLSDNARGDRGRWPSQARAADHHAAIGAYPHRGPRAQGGERELLNLCANNYLGLADHPEIIAAARDGARRVRLRHGLGALHLRHADAPPRARGARSRSWLGKDDAILFAACFDANGGLFETLLGARGRDHLRRAEPRLDHRRHPALQGEALPLRQLRHGRARDAAEGGRGRRRALQADRHRRRLLDGRLRRKASGDLRARRAVRRVRAWSTTATRTGISARRAGARRR